MGKKLRLSASAILGADERGNGCLIKDYFSKVLRLPQPWSKATLRGDVLHACVERYLKASEQGVDKRGNVVDLFPENWEYPVNKWTNKRDTEKIPLDDQQIIQQLVPKAIEEGIILRRKNRQVEHRLTGFKIMEDVSFIGFIDCLSPGMIEDHKSMKNLNYAKSEKLTTKNSLAKCIQMNCYGKYAFEKGFANPDTGNMEYRHNIFAFEPLKVQARTVEVTKEYVEEFLIDNVYPVIEKIKYTRDLPDWKDIPMPENTIKSCQAYGRRCPYATICLEYETPDEYLERYNQKIIKENITEKKTMGSASSLLQKVNQAKAKANGVETESTAKRNLDVDTEVRGGTSEVVAMPWYFKDCPACTDKKGAKALGLSTDGSLDACVVCDALNGKEGNPTSTDFDITVVGGDLVINNKLYTLSSEKEVKVTDKNAVETKVAKSTTQEKEEINKDTSEEEKEEIPKLPKKSKKGLLANFSQPEEATKEEPPAKKEQAKKEDPPVKKGLPKKDSTKKESSSKKEKIIPQMLINCTFVARDETKKTVLLHAVIPDILKLANEKCKVPPTHFEARDNIIKNADKIAKMLKGKKVLVFSYPKGSLEETVIHTLVPYTEEIISGVMG